MIGPKRVKLTTRQERAAYDITTARDRDTCNRCGTVGPCDRDHRQGRDAYNTVPSNLQLLGSDLGCGCHRWKTENPAAAIVEGFTVPRWARPELWPAWRHGAGWVLYDDTGGWREISQATADLLMNGGERCE